MQRRIFGTTLSVFISFVTILFLMKFLGVTWSDVDHFITHGIGGAIRILKMLRGSFVAGF